MPSYDVVVPASGVWGTAFLQGIRVVSEVNSAGTSRHEMVAIPNWGNLANVTGSAGTSGGAGTTVVSSGNYTWIG